jgi:uncharacterized protein
VRVVVDTNVWVSTLLNRSGAPALVLAALKAGDFTLLTSEPLLAELAEVLLRPRIARKYGITPDDADELVALLRRRAHVVPVVGEVRLCRDPDDDMVIETALRGRADMLVTRDEDLKGTSEVANALGPVGVAVVSVRRFLAALDEGNEPGSGPVSRGPGDAGR